MPRGRPRRSGSSSSIETIDVSRVKWCQETSVIKAAPKDEDPQHHILFEVQDVTIFATQGSNPPVEQASEYPNVLEVRIKGPFSARGTLVVEDDQNQKARVMIRRQKEIPIEIQTVSQLSIGETENRRPCIWILGRCGAWYEIVPSAAYKPTYNMMAEGVYLYYRIVDFYSTPSKRIKTSSKRDEITWLFFQYASNVGDGSTYEDVAIRCEKHALFLFYQFESEREFTADETDRSISWHTTEIYKWLKKRRNDALTAVQRALKEPLADTRDDLHLQVTKPKEPLSNAASDSAEAEGDPSAQRKSSEESSEDSSEESSDDSMSNEAKPNPSRGSSTARMSSSVLASRSPASDTTVEKQMVTPTHPLSDQDRVAVVALVEAFKVAWSLTKARPVKASSILQGLYLKYKFPDMRANGNYKKAVEEVLHYYARALVQDPAFEPFRGTDIHVWLLEKAEKPFRPECFGPDRFPFLITPRKRTERTREDSSTREAPSHPSVGGKSLPRGRPRKSNLSLGTGRKRPYAAVDGSSDEEPDHKKPFYASEGEDIVDDVPQHLEELSVEDDQTTVSYGEPVDFVIRADVLPSWATKRTDGAWVCDRNGCGYVVRGEAEDVARSRIQKHIAEHAPLRCNYEGCDFAVLEDDEDVAQLRMDQHNSALHGPWKCEREGCDFFARQENGESERRRVQEHIATHEKQEQKLNLAKSESRPHLPIEYGTLRTYLLQIIRTHPTLTSLLPSALFDPHPTASQSPELSADHEPLGVENLELAPDTKSEFRSLVDQFRRTARPVSDKIADLDVLQSLAREN